MSNQNNNKEPRTFHLKNRIIFNPQNMLYSSFLWFTLIRTIQQRNLSTKTKSKTSLVIKNQGNKQTQTKIIYEHFRSGVIYTWIHEKQIEIHLLEFWSFFKTKFPKHQFIIIQLKIIFKPGFVRSLSKIQIAHVSDFDKCLTVFNSIFDRENLLESNQIIKELSGEIVFLYKPLENTKDVRKSRFNLLDERYLVDQSPIDSSQAKILPMFDLKDLKIPRHMDLTEWPGVKISNDYTEAHAYHLIKDKNKQIKSAYYLAFTIFKDRYEIIVSKDGIDLYKIIDHMLTPSDLTYFKREIFNRELIPSKQDELSEESQKITNNEEKPVFTYKLWKTYLLSDGNIIYTDEIKKTHFIKKIQSDVKYSLDNLLTMDIETREINGVLIPLCLSVYNGKKAVTYMFNDPDVWKEEMKKVLLKYFTRKYHYAKIYFHNLAKFDGIFLLAALADISTITPIMKDGAIIQITAKLNREKEKQNITLVFRDSYLVLPQSLDSLSKSFNIKNKKTIFPVLFTNSPEFKSSYYGKVPEYKYFPKAGTKDFTLEDYKNYSSSFKRWSFKSEITKYCENDTIALYQILALFASEIFKKYRLDIFKYPTLPSIAFAIYRSNFMPANTLPKIYDNIYDELKHAYFGGIAESYCIRGYNIHSYDVNSLYPSSMKNYPMPVGKPTKFIGDPYAIDKDPFGFFFVSVNCPTNMKLPFLPHRANTGKGVRTICPQGTWKGWYFSEEIKNAQKKGYSFIIHKGYLFEKKFIFNDYVSSLYEIKCNTLDTDPMYTIVKLLLNALYGRLGLNPDLDTTKIVSLLESEDILIKYKVVDATPLSEDKVMITYNPKNKNYDDEHIKTDEVHSQTEDNLSSPFNSSVPIAAAISAYSRIEMSYYLYNYPNNIYAMDTDGIKIDTHLPKSLVDSKKLGKMKYEFTFKNAVFPAPKVYGGTLHKQYKKWDYEMVKVKGMKKAISFARLLQIIYDSTSITIPQQKWYKSIQHSAIFIKNEAYSLVLTDNKREILRNSWGEAIGTWPILMENGLVIRRSFKPLKYLPIFIRISPTFLQFYQVLSIILYNSPYLKIIQFIIYIYQLAIHRYINPKTSLTLFIIYLHVLALVKYIKPKTSLTLFIIYMHILAIVKYKNPKSSLTLFIIYMHILAIVKYKNPKSSLTLFIIYLPVLALVKYKNRKISLTLFIIYLPILALVSFK